MQVDNIVLESIHENHGNKKIVFSFSCRATVENEAEAKHLADYLKGVRGPMAVEFIPAQQTLYNQLNKPEWDIHPAYTETLYKLNPDTGEIQTEPVEPTQPADWKPEDGAEQAETPPDANSEEEGD